MTQSELILQFFFVLFVLLVDDPLTTKLKDESRVMYDTE